MTKRRVHLTYIGDVMKEPLIYHMSHKFNVITNIRGATIKGDIGLVTLELSGEPAEIDRSLEWAESQGVKVEPIEMEDAV
jgi:L-aspartate semialdehyde sulfurtransferase ferredoxin